MDSYGFAGLGGLGGVAPIRRAIRCGADSAGDSLWRRFAESANLAPLWPEARVASPPWPVDQLL